MIDRPVAVPVDQETLDFDLAKQRLAALLMSIPGWGRNFTASVDAAAWIIAEADRIGWQITIREPE